jgi:hypothetical protein
VSVFGPEDPPVGLEDYGMEAVPERFQVSGVSKQKTEDRGQRKIGE